ncbi:PrsW family intramembrane metalloprotease [Actinoplanes sp. NPDC051513]|uniref:PrsW family intramembrane metalloprotease n=1 Tax=Actinoplanes sp. NPDC051513 TaxID=3363908 RepID=UPI0037B2DD01
MPELTAREAAIEASGWGNKVYFWQPRNACLWVFVLIVGYGLWNAFGIVNGEIRVYGPALAASTVIFVVYGALFWWFTTRIDRYSRQPLSLIVAAFVWGGFGATWTFALSGNTALISLYSKLIGQNFSLDWGAGLSAPIFEELSKGAGVLLLMYIAPRVIRTAYDGFIIGAFAGLGFEILEDIFYALNAAPEEFGSHQLETSLNTVVLRLATGFSAHILYSAIFGAGLVYLVGTVAQRRRPGRGLIFVLTAMVLHGLWDSTTAIAGGNGIIVLVLLIGITLLAFAAVITVFNLTVGPERQTMRAVMAPEVEAGVLTADELDALSGGWRARRAYRRKERGRAARRLRHHRLEAAHDLADQIAASGGHETERVRFARAEMARLNAAGSAPA